VQAIDPPAEARRLHADVVQLLLLQHAAAAELLAIVNYEPRFRGALGPLSAAGKALARDIREAARTKSPPASAGSNVAAAMHGARAAAAVATRSLRPPPRARRGRISTCSS
jgi:hypothetical protein